jgi:hypothetical protein
MLQLTKIRDKTNGFMQRRLSGGGDSRGAFAGESLAMTQSKLATVAKTRTNIIRM